MTEHRKLSFGEKYQVMLRLNQVCRKDADGFAVYDDDLDDHVLAAQLHEDLDFDVNASHVAHLRRLEIGNFRRVEGGIAKVKASDLAGLSERVANIEEMLVSVNETLATVVSALEVVTEMMDGHEQKTEVVEGGDVHQLELADPPEAGPARIDSA